MTAPVPGLSDERLAAIQEREELNRLNGWHVDAEMSHDLLAEVVRLREERDKAQRRIAAVRKLVEESGGPEWSPLARISNDSIIRALAVEDGQT